MYGSEEAWRRVDAYFVDTLVPEDEALLSARESGRRTTMPQAEVAPNQGKLLALLCQIAGAARVLEFGTLAGYSTVWLARAARSIRSAQSERSAAGASSIPKYSQMKSSTFLSAYQSGTL